jgi:hypothetical protein
MLQSSGMLWDIYRATIDFDAGISPRGPAVRFIEAALGRMGYRRLPKHIESALDDRVDWRDEFLRRRPRRIDDLTPVSASEARRRRA